MPEAFLERDFKAYEKHRQDDPEYNALRLAVRRKLKAMADGVQKEAKALGTDLSAQAGLHHPYTFNAYRVREQRAYLCRGTKERKQLAASLGTRFGEKVSWFLPEILAVGADRLAEFQRAEPELKRLHDFTIDNQIRGAAHTLGAESENVLAAAGDEPSRAVAAAARSRRPCARAGMMDALIPY